MIYWYKLTLKNLKNFILEPLITGTLQKKSKKFLTLSGFREIKIKYIHNHGFNNFIHWMKKKTS